MTVISFCLYFLQDLLACGVLTITIRPHPEQKPRKEEWKAKR